VTAWSPRRLPGPRTRAPPTTWSRTKARLARRLGRPMQSGSPQPAGRGTAAVGSSGSAEGDLADLGRPPAAQATTTNRTEGLARQASDGGWTGGAQGHTRMGRRAGDARHDVADAWGIGRVWGPPVGARGRGSAGRTTRGANQGAATLPLQAF
jgi:hypothetical protein